MFFGGFGLTISTDLVALKGDPRSRRKGVTGRVIKACLERQLPEVLVEGMTFQHDNGPTFTSTIVQEWLQDWAYREGITLADWPPYSPDLNPVENLWSILKQRICDRYPELAYLKKSEAAKNRLIEAAKEVWDELEDEIFENLLNSMPKRIQALREAKGWYTRY